MEEFDAGEGEEEFDEVEPESSPFMGEKDSMPENTNIQPKKAKKVEEKPVIK